MAAPVELGMKWHQSLFYREAVENAVTYNSQLFQSKAKRLPYLDAQTGIAQTACQLLRSRLERRRGVAPGQLFSYPPRRWRREPQLLTQLSKVIATDSSHSGNYVPVTSALGGLIQTTEGKRSTRLATQTRPCDAFLTPLPGGRCPVSRESPGSSELNEEEESPEPADVDYLDEYDSEEERRQRRKRRSAPKSRTILPNSSRSNRSTDNEKPYLCNVCNRRYKTVASLKAHRTQYHGGEPTNKGSPAPPSLGVPSLLSTPSTSLSVTIMSPPRKPELRVPVILPPPPNVEGKEDAKPSPYCDFCLGDSNCNRKHSKPEKMVSCTNCGRSAHPSCMQFSDALSAVVHTYRWQCIECKSCHFCGTSENDDQLLFCDDCDRGYHMYCLRPPLKTPPEGSWACGMCYKSAI